MSTKTKEAKSVHELSSTKNECGQILCSRAQRDLVICTRQSPQGKNLTVTLVILFCTGCKGHEHLVGVVTDLRFFTLIKILAL